MKIALYSRVFPPAVGGMERFAEDLADWMANRGHSITVVTHTLAAPDVDCGRPYRVIRESRMPVTEGVFGSVDVVHINGLSLKGITAAFIAKRRPVVTHQGYQSICPVGLAWSAEGRCEGAAGTSGHCNVCPRRGFAGDISVRLHRAGANAASVNVCISHYLAERAKVPRSVTVYNPVAAKAFSTKPVNRYEGDGVAFAGRLVAEKGLDVLLNAMAMLPGIRLRIAGDGPMRSEWQRQAAEIGLGRRAEFLGALSFGELGDLYADAAVVCVPSAWQEPFGYAAAEAMAMGRAVVATPSGALPELLADGRGFVAAAPIPRALAAALEEALGDGYRRGTVERKARDFALSNLSMECVGPKYEALYQAAAS